VFLELLLHETVADLFLAHGCVHLLFVACVGRLAAVHVLGAHRVGTNWLWLLARRWSAIARIGGEPWIRAIARIALPLRRVPGIRAVALMTVLRWRKTLVGRVSGVLRRIAGILRRVPIVVLRLRPVRGLLALVHVAPTMDAVELMLEFFLDNETRICLHSSEKRETVIKPGRLLAPEDDTLVITGVTGITQQNQRIHQAHQAHYHHNTEMHRGIAHVVDPDSDKPE